MEQPAGFAAAGTAAERVARGPGGHPKLVLMDEIRGLMVETGLAPEPPAYELLWLHVTESDAALSRDLERLRAEGRLDAAAVLALRQQHLGEVAAAELQALLEAAQASAEQLAGRLAQGEASLQAYDGALSEGDLALAAATTASEIAELVQKLRRANATMLAANRRLEAELKAARLETGRLIDRLETAERCARTDPLTGLPNRRGAAQLLSRAMATAREAGTPLSVALVDIDHFKRVNDQWGHAIGDEVLRCVACHLAAHARESAGESAFAARHGGEEFLVAYPDLPLSGALAAMDRARAQLARQVLRRADDGASLGRISLSAGIAALAADDDPDRLLDRADAALYAAKRAGRDRVLPEARRR